MAVFDDFAERQDGCAEVIELAQAVPNFLASFGPRPASDDFLELGSMLPPRRRGGKAGIFTELIAADQRSGFCPDRIVHFRHAQREVAVSDLHGAIADAVAGEMLVQRARHKTEDGLLHRDFDFLAFAGLRTRIKRRENPQRDAYTGGFVTDAKSLSSECAVIFPCAMGPAGDAVVARCCVAIVG